MASKFLGRLDMGHASLRATRAKKESTENNVTIFN